MEALLFGQSNLLNTAFEDNYPNQLLERCQFIKHKYTLNHSRSIGMQFFRLRPPNFPTIRLAQLAQLYHTNKTVFSQLMTLERYDDFHLFLIVERQPFGIPIILLRNLQKNDQSKCQDPLLI